MILYNHKPLHQIPALALGFATPVVLELRHETKEIEDSLQSTYKTLPDSMLQSLRSVPQLMHSKHAYAHYESDTAIVRAQ